MDDREDDRDWLIRDLLVRGDTMILAAPPKVGKSLAVLDLAVSAATGGSWFGYECLDYADDEMAEEGRLLPREVVLVNLENPEDDQQLRLDSALSARGLTRKDLGGRLRMLNLKGSQAAWDLDELESRLRSLDPRGPGDIIIDYVIVDPIYMLIDGDENSNRAMAQFFGRLADIQSDLYCSLVLTHHFVKAWRSIKDNHADRIAGAGTLARSPEVIATLSPRGQRIELDITARRHDCRDVRGRVYRQEGPRFIECGPDEVELEAPVDTVRAETLAAIDALAAGGPVKLQELAHSLGKNRATIRERVMKYGFRVEQGKVVPAVGGDLQATTINPPSLSTTPVPAGG